MSERSAAVGAATAPRIATTTVGEADASCLRPNISQRNAVRRSRESPRIGLAAGETEAAAQRRARLNRHIRKFAQNVRLQFRADHVDLRHFGRNRFDLDFVHVF